MSDIDANPTTDTRESWLRRAAVELRVMIEQVSGIEVPEFHVSIGFGGTRYEKGVRGVCWHTSCSSDGRNQVFISPELPNAEIAILVLLHEMIHVALNNSHGHKGKFREIAGKLGLVAPFTTATPDAPLSFELMSIAHGLGEFPHAALNRTPVAQPVPVGPGGEPIESPTGGTSGPKAQNNRWFKAACPTHGNPWRASRKAFAAGLPLCGIEVEDEEMGVEGPCGQRLVPEIVTG
jgi:hypothetical protein